MSAGLVLPNWFSKGISKMQGRKGQSRPIRGLNATGNPLHLASMKHVSILVPAGDAVVGSIEGPHKVLSQVNELLAGAGSPPAFQIELVGLTKHKTFNRGLFTLHAHRTIDEDFRTDLIIIPAPHGDLAEAVALNQDLIAWIAEQHAAGAEVASLCLGAFLLAATGLLDGRQCATHWLGAPQFAVGVPPGSVWGAQVAEDEL